MTLHSGDLDSMWKKLGFEIDYSRKDVVATLRIDGKLAAWTKRSHGTRKLDGDIPRFIRKQMNLTQQEFVRAVECPLKQPEYFEILRSRGRYPSA